MTKISGEKFLLLGLLLLSGIGCDQTTKRIIEQTLSPSVAHSYFFDTIRIQLIKNSGAFLGFGSHFSDEVKFWLFIVLPLIVLSVGFFLVIISRRIDFLKKIMIVIMLSGGIGNLIDRIAFNGMVTDFINLGIGRLRTGIFNVADVAIMFGAFGLILIEFLKNRRHLDQ